MWTPLCLTRFGWISRDLTSQNVTNPWRSAAASVDPSGLTATATTAPLAPSSDSLSRPLVKSQIRTAGFTRSPSARSRPSGEIDKGQMFGSSSELRTAYDVAHVPDSHRTIAARRCDGRSVLREGERRDEIGVPE